MSLEDNLLFFYRYEKLFIGESNSLDDLILDVLYFKNLLKII